MKIKRHNKPNYILGVLDGFVCDDEGVIFLIKNKKNAVRIARARDRWFEEETKVYKVVGVDTELAWERK